MMNNMEYLYIGKVLKVVEQMKEEMIYQIKMIKLDDTDFETSEVENILDNEVLYLECINGIYQDLITDNLSRNDEIGIYYNPMGNLYYERIGDEDNE